MSNVIENIAKQVLAEADPVLKDIDTVHKGVYNPTLQYVKNNIITYNGSSYMCSIPAKGIVPTDTGYWQLIGSKGDKGDQGSQGIQGISFESRGQYDSNAIYNTGDVVIDSINQNLYASLIDNNQHNVVTDTTKWELLISVQSTVTSANNAATTANTSATNANTAATNVSNAESSRVTAEQARVTSEGTRSSAETTRGNNETSRQTAETNRASAESSRVTTESNRVSDESDRATAESNRANAESSRVSVESSRVTTETNRANAESTRVSNETSRGNAESARATVESNRVTAETNRANAETSRASTESSRVTEESNRVSAESTRAGNETPRQTNESTRQTNESIRQSQETTRQTAISNLNHLGAWSSATAYQPRNVVSLNGSSYMCTVPNTNQVPPNSTYWQVVGQKGADGTGSGSVTSVDSSNSDITVTSKTTTPTITLNSGTGANQIVKLDVDALVIADILKDGTTNKAYTAVEKTKLSGVSTGATKTESSVTNGNVKIDSVEITVYTHPANHPASIITQDASNRFVTDTEKSTWNGKQDTLGFTPENIANKGIANGYASLDASGDVPLTQIPALPPSTVTQDASNRFVTDTEKTTWNGKQNALGFTPVSKLRTYMGVRF